MAELAFSSIVFRFALVMTCKCLQVEFGKYSCDRMRISKRHAETK